LSRLTGYVVYRFSLDFELPASSVVVIDPYNIYKLILTHIGCHAVTVRIKSHREIASSSNSGDTYRMLLPLKPAARPVQVSQ